MLSNLTSLALKRTSLRSSVIISQSTVNRYLTTESLKVADATPAPVVERIKYFKIYRWDPEQEQKPYLVSESQCCGIFYSMSNSYL